MAETQKIDFSKTGTHVLESATVVSIENVGQSDKVKFVKIKELGRAAKILTKELESAGIVQGAVAPCKIQIKEDGYQGKTAMVTWITEWDGKPVQQPGEGTGAKRGGSGGGGGGFSRPPQDEHATSARAILHQAAEIVKTEIEHGGKFEAERLKSVAKALAEAFKEICTITKGAHS